MRLIHLQGLSCYHDCLITLANAFGINYILSFSRLWSEGKLHYAPTPSAAYFSPKGFWKHWRTGV